MSASQKQALRPCSAALEKKKEALLKSSKKKKKCKNRYSWNIIVQDRIVAAEENKQYKLRTYFSLPASQ